MSDLKKEVEESMPHVRAFSPISFWADSLFYFS